MYLTEDEARERLNHSQNLSNVVVEFKRRAGRPTGSPRLSDSARAIVASAAQVLPVKEIAEAFNLHPKTVSNLKRGVSSNTSLGRQVKNEDLEADTKKLEEDRTSRISSKALDILLATLEGVDPNKVTSQVSKVKMAKDLAIVHEKMMGKGPQEGLTKVVVYAPRQRDIKEFDVIEVQAQVTR